MFHTRTQSLQCFFQRPLEVSRGPCASARPPWMHNTQWSRSRHCALVKFVDRCSRGEALTRLLLFKLHLNKSLKRSSKSKLKLFERSAGRHVLFAEMMLTLLLVLSATETKSFAQRAS